MLSAMQSGGAIVEQCAVEPLTVSVMTAKQTRCVFMIDQLIYLQLPAGQYSFPCNTFRMSDADQTDDVANFVMDPRESDYDGAGCALAQM